MTRIVLILYTVTALIGLFWGLCAPVDAQAVESSWWRDDAIDNLLESIEVDEPMTYGGMTLFPVRLRKGYSDFEPATFDQAIRKGDLVVKEIGEGRVDTVRVKNHGRRPVFIMAGEIMSGSKQDRIARHDVLIPKRSGWIEISVYCVEAGRWEAKTSQFSSKGSVAHPGLRKKAYGGQRQESIWSEVDSMAGELGVRQSRDRAFQEVYEDRDVQKKIDEYMKGLPIPRHLGAVGFVAFSGHRVIGADVFGNEALFEGLRDKLIRSYILSVNKGRGEWGGRPSQHEAARFLARAWSDHCKRTAISTPGMGENYRLRNDTESTSGGASLYRHKSVHVSLFPESVKTGPVPLPMPMPQPVPRQRIPE
ncbi:ARPP-1 family domain-containing protein [Acidobacteriota bacterium]